ncbi:MAG: antibiotic biosynthesis monooxygenase [Acidimicrobiales bacterium]|nr:antibiotic biosynthesis monooxygenase [Acidimicrobiales bacterium]
MIIIAGTLDFADGAGRDAAVAASAELQQATRDDEPGCVAYCMAADPCVTTRIQVYEAWTDQPSLAAHFEHENYTGMRTLLHGFDMTGSDAKKYRVDLVEPVYDETRTARADFFTEEE